MRQTSHLQPDTNAGRWRYGILPVLSCVLFLTLPLTVSGQDREIVRPLLETSTDAESLIAEAMILIDENRVQDGLRVLEQVRDRWGGLIYETPQNTFVPIESRINDLIASLTDEALMIYRFEADPTVRRLLGEPVDQVVDETLLRQVVDRYFNSSLGDDAAYRLANLALDSGRLYLAEQLLRQIIQAHPDPDVDEQEIYYRLLIIATVRGQRDEAAEWLGKLNPQTRQRVNQLDWEQVRLALQFSGPIRIADQQVDPALQAPTSANRLRQVWEQELTLDAELLFSRYAYIRRQRMISRSQLVDRWRTQQWLPTGEIVTTDDLLLVKDQRSLVAFDKQTGLIRWQANEPALPPNIGPGQVVGYRPGPSPAIPQTPEGILAFGDRISPQLTVADGIVYHIEGFGFGRGYGAGASIYLRNQIRPMGTTLAAHDVATGRLRWRSNFDPNSTAGPDAYRIISRPRIVDDLLLLAVEFRNSEISIIALDRRSGEERWRRFLIGYELEGAPPWVPVEFAIDGNDLAVATHRGVVMLLDVDTGRIRWGTSYPRVVPTDRGQRRIFPWQSEATFWEKGGIFFNDELITLFPGDASAIIQLDRIRGRIVRDVVPDHTGHVIGWVDRGILTATPTQITQLAPDSLEVLWTRRVGGLTGLPRLVGGEILLPTNDRLLMVDARDGKTLREYSVAGLGEAPLGNVFSDGRYLYGIGAQQIYALTEPISELERLNEELAKRDESRLRIARGLLLASMESDAEAVKDFEAVLKSRARRQEKEAASEFLFARLLRGDDDARLQRAGELAKSPTQIAQVLLRRGDIAAENRDFALATSMYQDLIMMGNASLIAYDPNDPQILTAPSELGRARMVRLAREPDAGPLIEELATKALANFDKQRKEDQLVHLLGVIRAYPNTSAAMEAAEEAFARFDANKQSALAGLLARELRRSPNEALRQKGLFIAARHAQRSGWDGEARELYRKLLELRPERRDEAGLVIEDEVRQRYLDAVVGLSDSLKRADDLGRLDAPPWELKQDLNIAQPWILEFTTTAAHRDELTPWLSRHIFVYQRTTGKLLCIEIESGRKLWERTLENDLRQVIRRSNRAYAIRGGIDGHVAVMYSQTRVVAMSLNDGRTLWTRTVAEDLRSGRGSSGTVVYSMPITPNDADLADGLFFEKHQDPGGRADLLIARDVMTGEPVWKRRVDEHQINQVAARDGLLVAAINRNQGYLAIEARTGQLLNEINTQDQSSVSIIGLTESGAILRTSNSVLLKDYRTGDTRWTYGTSELARRVTVLTNDDIFVQRQDFAAVVLDGRTGKTRVFNKLDLDETTGIIDVGYDPSTGQLVMITRNRQNELNIFIGDKSQNTPIRQIKLESRIMSNLVSAQTLAEMGPWLIWTSVNRSRENNRSVMKMIVEVYPRVEGQPGEVPTISPPDGQEFFAPNSSPLIVIQGQLVLPLNDRLQIYGSKEKPDKTDTDEEKEESTDRKDDGQASSKNDGSDVRE